MSKIPDGTQFIEAGCGEKGFRKFEKGCWWFFEDFWRHVDWKMGALTLVTEHPDYAVPATPRTGAGLPALGSTVRIINIGLPVWPEAEKFFGTDCTLCAVFMTGDTQMVAVEHQADAVCCCFRADMVRTPEQIEQQELREALEELAPHIAGYMGRDDPGSVDVGLAAYLLDQGYRKQVAP